MGCESSQVDKPLGIRVNILDSNFTKNQNEKIRQKMQKLDIKYEVYLSMSCLIQDMLRVYTNEVIVAVQMLDSLLQQLQKAHFHPNIYVLSPKEVHSQKQHHTKFPIKHFKSYDDIITQLSQKTLRKRNSAINPAFERRKQHVVLKIFRKSTSSGKSSQQMIFQQTLKSKNITYEIYHTFSQLQASLQITSSNWIVTDYVYHRQVINLVETTPTTRVICFCEFQQEQSYDPRVYFITNNFLEIVTEIVAEEKVAHMNFVKCSKVYIYSNQNNLLSEYAESIEHFGFQVKIYTDLNSVIKESRYFFAVTVLISPQERKEVEAFLEGSDYLFKTKIVEIKKGTPNSVKGLRKIIKELKKGYRAAKGLTRTIDIIDKHFDNVKFDSIKQELQKYDIRCYGYTNLNDYIKHKKFMSPFIISNFQERSLVIRYLKEIKSQSKVVLFCNKNHISAELKINKQFAFVSSHFGKIINFIKKNNVYNPFILDENEVQIKNKKEKLNKNNKRISALNWCANSGELAGSNSEDAKDFIQMERKFEFMKVSEGVSLAQIASVQKEFAGLFNLQYSPLDCPQKLKENFISSLHSLKTLFKINYPSQQFQKLVSSIQTLTTSELATKMLSFFSSQNELGVKINKSLINIEALTKEEIVCLKEYMLLVNLNFLSVYRDSFAGRVKLRHYLNSKMIEKCSVGSTIFNKNYSIFYCEDDLLAAKETTEDHITSYRVELDLDINPICEKNPEINSYFRFERKFVFSPYSQFQITAIEKRGNCTVVSVQYKKNVEFLKCYFAENLYKKKPNLLTVCEEELERSKTSTKGSFMFDDSTKDAFSRNVLRTKAITFFQGQKIDEAIKCQKQLIIREESLQNFDSAKLQWLNYQLACYYQKSGNDTESKRILNELVDAEPSDYLRKCIKSLNRDMRKNSRKSSSTQKSSSNTSSKKTMDDKFKDIEIGLKKKNSSEGYDNIVLDGQSSEQSDEENIFDAGELGHEIQCLDIQMMEDFEREQKENVY